MDTAIVVVGVLVALALLALFVPARLVLSAQGRGDPSGAWALAAGAQLGPFVASGVGARGVTPRVELKLFGRRLWGEELGAKKHDHAPPKKHAHERLAGIERWFDLESLGLWLLDERRRVRVDEMVVELRYSFQDVATTGKMLGAVYVLSGILPPPIELRQEVSWDSEDRASAALNARVKLRPGLLLVDSALFVLRNVKLRQRSRTSNGEAETT